MFPSGAGRVDHRGLGGRAAGEGRQREIPGKGGSSKQGGTTAQKKAAGRKGGKAAAKKS
jgi:hypothetical protein